MTRTVVLLSWFRRQALRRSTFISIEELEAMVAEAITSYLAEQDGANATRLEQLQSKLGLRISRLTERYLHEAGWEGWHDGVTFAWIANLMARQIACAGYVYWSDHEARTFWLDSFHAWFSVDDSSRGSLQYCICYRSETQRFERITADDSAKRMYKYLRIPGENDPIIETEWVYAFRKPVR